MTEPFKFSDGQLAYTAEELISLCQKSPDERVTNNIDIYLSFCNFVKIATN